LWEMSYNSVVLESKILPAIGVWNMADISLPNTWRAVQKGASWAVLDKEGKTIATIKGTGSDKRYAKLIAASPYMLEALKATASLIGDEDPPDNGEISGAAVCDMIRSALEISA
jgi:hypothetical protein